MSTVMSLLAVALSICIGLVLTINVTSSYAESLSQHTLNLVFLSAITAFYLLFNAFNGLWRN